MNHDTIVIKLPQICHYSPESKNIAETEEGQLQICFCLLKLDQRRLVKVKACETTI
jgi:hypothetical protein